MTTYCGRIKAIANLPNYPFFENYYETCYALLITVAGILEKTAAFMIFNTDYDLDSVLNTPY